MTNSGKVQTISDIQTGIDQILQGYRKSNILFSAYDTGILTYLASHTVSIKVLSHLLNLSEKGTGRLVSALVAMGLVRKTKELYRLKKTYRPFFAQDSEINLGPLIEHEKHLQKRWLNLSESVKHGKPIKTKAEGQKPENRKRFIAAMANVGQKSALSTIEKIDFRGDEKLLDLAGGPGIYLKCFCETYPDMNVTLLDLPDTIKTARNLLSGHPQYHRMNFMGVDLFEADFGRSYDIIFFSNAIHIFDEQEIKQIFKKCHKSLKNKGRILIKDFYLNDQNTGPEFSSIFSLHMLLSTEGGGCYKVSEISKLLQNSGFVRGRKIKITENSLVLEGIKY